MMNKRIEHSDVFDTARFVEVLTTDETGATFGYRIGGDRPGPNVLAAGYAPHTEQVFDRLAKLPTLPWMWGKLYIVILDRLDPIFSHQIASVLPGVSLDRTFLLPVSSRDYDSHAAVDRDYWTILNACASLGMISGRGIRALY